MAGAKTESSADRLSPLQRELLVAFFEHERGFFLTGGAALAGFYLHHRETDDLDLFTHESEAFERGMHALRAAADRVSGQLAITQDSPGFRRCVVTRGHEAVVVDLVLERAGHRAEQALAAALAKDGGCTPAALPGSCRRSECPRTPPCPAV